MKNYSLNKGAKALLLFLLLYVAGMMKVANAQSLKDWELEQPFLFYLVYDDVQAWVTKMPNGSNSHAIREEQLPVSFNQIGNWSYNSNLSRGWLCLAKNEREGFQVFYREHEKSRNLRVEVSPFLNAQNEVLEHMVYYEEFFRIDTILTGSPSNDLKPIDDSLAEALVPYFGEPKVTQVNYNKMFYIELISTKDQRHGEYTATVSLYEGDELLASKPVTARVWNFALPEGHYSEVVMGLYNRNSGYKSTSTFLTLNGINVDANGNVAPEDMEEAKRIVAGYQNCLLEHGVSTYEIPRWLIDDDPKAAELTMADPRRKVFTVPIHYGDLNSSGTDFKPSAQQVLQQYKDIVYDNSFLKDKAFFYPKDEPHTPSDFAAIDQFCSVISNYWPGYHATIPFYSEYYSTIQAFEGKIDILCPSHSFFNPGNNFANAKNAEPKLRDYMTRPHTWWKPDNPKIGGLDFYVYITGSPGVIRRILFWQQYLAHGQGMLYWNCAFLPDNWEKKHMPLPEGIRNGNGDGILLYPGTMFGQDAATPVVSLRLKQLSAGIDDYDYMRLVEEFLGEQKVWEYLGRAFHFGRHYFPDTLCGAWNKELEVFRSYTCHPTQINRWWYGRLLDEAANTEHSWGEWQTAVLPDETHNGLEIRTCSHCGAQESREKTFLYRFLGTEDNEWTNLNNWESNPETLPAPGEAVVIAHDCEIDTDITVFHVVVNDGFELTVNEGATLTSRRITTEGNAQVIVEDGAQLNTNSEGVQVTIKKNIVPCGDTDGWHFVSTSLASDVEPSTSNGILPSAEGNYDLYYFDQSENLEWRNHKAQNFDFENSKGYLYANSEEDVRLVFTGTTNGNTAKEVSLVYDTSAYCAGWNLVGNPYPCQVYANRSYYRMNEERTAIEPVAVSGAIAIDPCTGVMVKADTQGEFVVFSKEEPDTVSYKGSLQIAVAEAGNWVGSSTSAATDKAILSFNEGDELAKFVFNDDDAQLYIPKNGKDYAIAYVGEESEMPFNFKAAKDGPYTLSVNLETVKMNYLHLIDNLTGADIDLLVTPNYTFEAKLSDAPNRFVLVLVEGAQPDICDIEPSRDLIPLLPPHSSGNNEPAHSPTSIIQEIAISAGWNWFSTNLDIALEDLQNALVESTPNTTITIKSQNSGQTTWNGRLWVGTLRTMDVSQMYMISVANACEITLEGLPINPAEHPVTISNGPNWIGFPLGATMTITNAFAGFAASGDIVKSDGGGQATWNGRIWTGQLKNLEPGKGYVYESAATGSRTFIFPTGTK